MSEEENDDKNNINVRADNNSTAVGKVSVGGNVDGPMVFGNNNQLTQNIYQSASGEDLSTKTLSRNEKMLESETIVISEGEVWMGVEDEQKIPDDEKPHYRIYLPLYRISKYPITNVQYKKFVQEIKNSDNSTGKWDGLKIPDGPDDDPVQGVTLDNAIAYCIWLGNETKRNYSIPNEAQLQKAYKEPDGYLDVVENLMQWTCTLWGAKALAPDEKYRYPSTENEQNNLYANSQIRRVVCNFPRQENEKAPRVRQRSGKFPWDEGFPGARHGFRVVMEVPPVRKAE